jgi:hypothetical protein
LAIQGTDLIPVIPLSRVSARNPASKSDKQDCITFMRKTREKMKRGKKRKKKKGGGRAMS